MKNPRQIHIPTYSSDKRQLLQITEMIIDGKVVIQSIPLSAYQLVQIPR